MHGGRMQACAIGLLTGLAGVLLVHSFRMAYLPEGNDFTSYLRAAQALWNGQDPYRIDMPFPYLYPLFLAFVLIPFTWIPYWLANVFWLGLCAASLAASCLMLLRIAQRECGGVCDRRVVVPALAALLIFFPPILSTMLQGQVNPIVLFCCVLFYCEYVRKRNVRAGVWLGAAVALKVLPAALLAFLIVRRQWRAALWTVVFAALFCVLPVVAAGERLATYYRSYLDGFLLASVAYPMANTATHFSFHGAVRCFLPGVPDLWLKIACGAAVAAAVATVEFAAMRRGGAGRTIWAFCAYLIGVLMISPMVEIHHLVLAVPAVFLLTVKLFFDRAWRTPAVALWSAAFVACFNLAARLDQTMLCCFASLGILLVLLWLAVRQTEVNIASQH